VMVVTGALFEPFAQGTPVDLLHMPDSLTHATHSDEVFALARTITADPLWNALIDQAVIDANGEFDLIPRIGGNRVKVGALSGTGTDACATLTARLDKLKTFYEQGIPQSDWRMYSTIDTRFADQVVCTKRSDYRPAPKKPASTTPGNATVAATTAH
jgi:cell division protein FtsQ